MSKNTGERNTSFKAGINSTDFVCKVCGLSAKDKCGGCNASWYCGKQCQTYDWEEHKGACNEVQLPKKLERIAKLIHEAYLKFRENTWDMSILKVEENGNELIVYDGKDIRSFRYFVPFPEHLKLNETSKMGILCLWMCNEPIAYLHPLITKLLKGMARLLSPQTVQSLRRRS